MMPIDLPGGADPARHHSAKPGHEPVTNRRWPWRGESLDALMGTLPEVAVLAPPASDEIVARVEAVSICSSDLKVVRMGRSHPLLAGSPAGFDTVLGHEVCLRVHAVGSAFADRFHPGQRLALQPSLPGDGVRRKIIGMDLPGGFAQFLRLDRGALEGEVMPVPEALAAAEIALLEPYGCVERAWRPNARTALLPGGRALVVSAPGADFHLAEVPDWASITVVGALPSFLQGRPVQRLEGLEALQGRFDDILALGDLTATQLGQLAAALAVGGMLVQGRSGSTPGQVQLDPARVHYDRLAFLGTGTRDLATAFAPERQRFDARPGGVALVHGAGGAMGRIHVHRLLQHARGPATVIATSRKGQRLSDLQRDFGPIAEAAGRRLLAVEAGELDAVLAREAPAGLDDAVVVAPSPEAVAAVSGRLAPGGLLALFAGFPYGTLLGFDLARVALDGMRLTGSTGCTLEDMRGVLDRVEAGALALSANIAAVGGLDALPQALSQVEAGTVSGKIVLYPQRPELPLRAVCDWTAKDEGGLTGTGSQGG